MTYGVDSHFHQFLLPWGWRKYLPASLRILPFTQHFCQVLSGWTNPLAFHARLCLAIPCVPNWETSGSVAKGSMNIWKFDLGKWLHRDVKDKGWIWKEAEPRVEFVLTTWNPYSHRPILCWYIWKRHIHEHTNGYKAGFLVLGLTGWCFLFLLATLFHISVIFPNETIRQN